MEINEEQALDCFASDDLIGLGMEADAVRRILHPENVVTYVVTRPISLGNDVEEFHDGFRDAVSAGDTTAFLVPVVVTTDLTQLEETLAAIRSRYLSLRLHALSTGEILTLVEASGLAPGEVLTRLRAAGLDSFSGDDLCAIENDSTSGFSLEEWLEVHRLAHERGIHTSAGLVLGMGEPPERRVELLLAIRRLQEQTGGFFSFEPRSYKPPTLRSEFEEPTAVEYLRTLAISRIVLDNIENIESGCTAQGLKVTQMALRFGANDAGSIAAKDSPSKKRVFTEEDLRRIIRDAGLRPVERDLGYRTVFLGS